MQEETLRRERDFRVLFAHNPMPMWVYDLPTLRVLAVNDAAIACYGYTREEFLGMTLRDLRPEEDVPALLRVLSRERTALGSTGILRHRKKDGTLLLVETSTNLIPFQGHEATLVLISDVTEREKNKQARHETEERFRQVVENIHEVFWMLDLAEQKLLYVSPGYETIWGRTCASLYACERSWSDAIYPEDRERVLHARTVKLPAGDYHETYRIVDPQQPHKTLAHIERASSRFWGTLTFGAHANGYVADENGRPEALWIARRSPHKATDPGLLDNLVGGGVPFNQSPHEALLREAWEEAGLPDALARGARFAGVLELHRDIPEGLQHEQLHAFDLSLPAELLPINQDGEVASFERLAVDELIQRRLWCQMTTDAALVTLDFLCRHLLVPESG